MSERKKAFLIYIDWCNTILELTDDPKDALTDAELGQLMKCIFRYQAHGEDTSECLPKHTRYIFKNMLDGFNRDYEKWETIREKRRQSGRKGGLAKSNNSETKTQEKPKNPVGYSGLDEQKPAKKEKPVKHQTQFDDFYKLYPRKVGKQTALKAYEKALKTTTHDKIIEGVERYKKHIQSNKTEPQFIAMPATWLNGGRWDDDYNTSTVTAQKPADYWDTSRNKYFIERD